MKVSINQTTVTLVGVAVLGVVGYLGYSKLKAAASEALSGAKQALDETVAAVDSAWQNNVAGPFQRGQDWAAGNAPVPTDRQLLYSDAGYSGNDPVTGQPVITGEWYGNATARSYEAGLLATAPQVKPVGVNGLTSGYYLPNIMTAQQRNAILTIQARGRVVGGL